MRTGDNKISFPRSEIRIAKNDALVLGVGVKNKKDSELDYTIDFTYVSGPLADSELVESKWFQYPTSIQHLKPSEPDVKTVRLSVPSKGDGAGGADVKVGSYLFTFNVMEGDEVYASKDFFVVVTG